MDKYVKSNIGLQVDLYNLLHILGLYTAVNDFFIILLSSLYHFWS